MLALPRAVWLLCIGAAVNAFGFGLVLPWEIVYLHEHRGFGVAVAGLVLSTIMGFGALSSTPAGLLAHAIGERQVAALGLLLSASGYAVLAYITQPWQAFGASIVAGIGFGMYSAAGPALTARLVTSEQRAMTFSLARVCGNLGSGVGSVAAGFIVVAGTLRSFQLLYLLNAASFVAFVGFLVLVPDRRAERSAAGAQGYSSVLRDRSATTLLIANAGFVIVGFTFFGLITSPYGRYVAHLGSRTIGIVAGLNVVFMIGAQLPIGAFVRGRPRIPFLQLMALLSSLGCAAMIPAGTLPPLWAAIAFVLVGWLSGTALCLHAALIAPSIAELATPQLLGRYMALLALSMSMGYALGPAIGSFLFATGHRLPWAIGAIAMLALTQLFRSVQLNESPRFDATPITVAGDA